MPKQQNKKYKQPPYDDIIEELQGDDTFEIGQVYEQEAATTLGCKKCGGTDFKVGQGSYYTAIKCVACGWQRCIHEG